MGDGLKIVSGVGGLIVVYLLLANASSFNTIATSIASSGSTLITTLQGRSA